MAVPLKFEIFASSAEDANWLAEYKDENQSEDSPIYPHVPYGAIYLPKTNRPREGGWAIPKFDTNRSDWLLCRLEYVRDSDGCVVLHETTRRALVEVTNAVLFDVSFSINLVLINGKGKTFCLFQQEQMAILQTAILYRRIQTNKSRLNEPTRKRPRRNVTLPKF